MTPLCPFSFSDQSALRDRDRSPAADVCLKKKMLRQLVRQRFSQMGGQREHSAKRAHPHADTRNRSVRIAVDDDDRAQLLPVCEMGLVFEEEPRIYALKKRGCLGGVEASDGVDGEPDLVASDDGAAQRGADQLRISAQIVQKRVTLPLCVRHFESPIV